MYSPTPGSGSRVSAVILTFNGLSSLKHCLAAVAAQNTFDLVLTGNARDIDIVRLVRLERDLIAQMQRLNSTVTRYAIARFGG